MTVYNHFKAVMFNKKYGKRGLSHAELTWYMSLPGTTYRIILDQSISLTGLKLLYRLREQVEHSIQVKIDSEGLNGWGGLSDAIIEFFRRVLAFEEELQHVLAGGERFRYVLEYKFGYDFPDEYKPLLNSRGMKFCIVDNLLGNLMGYYDGHLIDNDDFDYLFAIFEDLEEQGAHYSLTPGDDRDPRVKIKEG